MTPRRRVLFLFLDGVGLGDDDPAVNPLAADAYPTLAALLEGRRPVAATGRVSTDHAELIPTDACLGVAGRPQSATGQAAILTGINAAQRLGEHFGPRPDARVRAILDEGGVFHRLTAAGRSAYFCNAYPQSYFDAVQRGKRLLSAVPYAATVAGQELLTYADLCAGRALSADFTGEGWRAELGYHDAPLYTPQEAGHVLWQLSQPHDFVFFEVWMTDVLGHARNRDGAVAFLARFDGFLSGLLEAADLAQTLIVVASDHGNVEDCRHGKHTTNPAMTLLLGADRGYYAAQIADLTDFVPVITTFLGVPAPENRPSAARL
jgi:hypothetical protein